MATADRKDPYLGFYFRIELDGIDRGGFREASGLDCTTEPTEYREGNEKTLTARKLPALNKYSNITLKWGISDDPELWEWRKKAIQGHVERKNGAVVLMNEAGEPKWRWEFQSAWPTKYTAPSFNATSNDVAIETLEIVHEGIDKKKA